MEHHHHRAGTSDNHHHPRAGTSDSVYYDKDGRVYYRGKDLHSRDNGRHLASTSASTSALMSHTQQRAHATTSLPLQQRHNHASHYQHPVTSHRVPSRKDGYQDGANHHGKHAPVRHTRSYDADKMTSHDDVHRLNFNSHDRLRSRSIDKSFAQELAARGYRIVRDDSHKSSPRTNNARRKLHDNHSGHTNYYGTNDRRFDTHAPDKFSNSGIGGGGCGSGRPSCEYASEPPPPMPLLLNLSGACVSKRRSFVP